MFSLQVLRCSNMVGNFKWWERGKGRAVSGTKSVHEAMVGALVHSTTLPISICWASDATVWCCYQTLLTSIRAEHGSCPSCGFQFLGELPQAVLLCIGLCLKHFTFAIFFTPTAALWSNLHPHHALARTAWVVCSRSRRSLEPQDAPAGLSPSALCMVQRLYQEGNFQSLTSPSLHRCGPEAYRWWGGLPGSTAVYYKDWYWGLIVQNITDVTVLLNSLGRECSITHEVVMFPLYLHNRSLGPNIVLGLGY